MPAETVLRVLVVDDNADIRRLARLQLELEDDLVVVGEAGDGAAALALAEQTRADVVILDLAMPVMDGLEALPGLRRLLPEARIVVFSAFDEARYAAAAASLGADAYVEKGRALADLVAVVRAGYPAGGGAAEGGIHGSVGPPP